MNAASRRALLALALATVAACEGKRWPPAPTATVDAAVTAATEPAPRQQVKPSIPLAPPPADAERITGLPEAPTEVVLIKRLAAGTGERPGRNDTVRVELTGWRANGDTFLSTAERKRPLPKSLALMAPGFAAAVQTMQVGERAMVWVPAALGYAGTPQGPAEDTIYEVVLAGFDPAPPTPPDVGAPPATATTTPSGLRTLVVKPSTGRTPARGFDKVTYHYSAWDATGRMFDSSELRGRPYTTMPMREWRGLEEALTLMTIGERRRVWLPPTLSDQSLPGLPRGVLCYELELIELVAQATPPSTPTDLASVPTTAITTAGGARYVIVEPGPGDRATRPTLTDRVRVHFSGWTPDGHMFDSSVPQGTPIEAPVNKFLAGWVEVLPQMAVGDRARVWLPVALAFNDEPGRPQGPVVFELSLLAIVPPTPPTVTPAPPGVKLVPPPAPTAPASATP